MAIKDNKDQNEQKLKNSPSGYGTAEGFGDWSADKTSGYTNGALDVLDAMLGGPPATDPAEVMKRTLEQNPEMAAAMGLSSVDLANPNNRQFITTNPDVVFEKLNLLSPADQRAFRQAFENNKQQLTAESHPSTPQAEALSRDAADALQREGLANNQSSPETPENTGQVTPVELVAAFGGVAGLGLTEDSAKRFLDINPEPNNFFNENEAAYAYEEIEKPVGINKYDDGKAFDALHMGSSSALWAKEHMKENMGGSEESQTKKNDKLAALQTAQNTALSLQQLEANYKAAQTSYAMANEAFSKDFSDYQNITDSTYKNDFGELIFKVTNDDGSVTYVDRSGQEQDEFFIADDNGNLPDTNDLIEYSVFKEISDRTFSSCMTSEEAEAKLQEALTTYKNAQENTITSGSRMSAASATDENGMPAKSISCQAFFTPAAEGTPPQPYEKERDLVVEKTLEKYGVTREQWDNGEIFSDKELTQKIVDDVTKWENANPRPSSPDTQPTADLDRTVKPVAAPGLA